MTIERFRKRRRGAARRRGHARRANRIEWANRAPRRSSGSNSPRDRATADRQPGAPAGVHASTSSRATVASRPSSSQPRGPAGRSRLQVVPFGVARSCCCRATSRRSKRVARMRRDFIANVSHELRTPLTVLGRLPRDGAGPGARAAARTRYLRLMQEQATRMQRLVDDLLDALRARERARTRCRTTAFAVVPLLLELSRRRRGAVAGRARDPLGHRRGRDRRSAVETSSRARSATW